MMPQTIINPVERLQPNGYVSSPTVRIPVDEQRSCPRHLHHKTLGSLAKNRPRTAGLEPKAHHPFSRSRRRRTIHQPVAPVKGSSRIRTRGGHLITDFV